VPTRCRWFEDADLDLPVAEAIAARGLSLPSFPTMTDQMVDRVCAAMRVALDQAG
jgi:dTDP-4-amino-4,6-dideoxygalactose transaminase